MDLSSDLLSLPIFRLTGLNVLIHYQTIIFSSLMVHSFSKSSDGAATFDKS